MITNALKVTILLCLCATYRVDAEETVRIAFFTHMGEVLGNRGDGMFIAGAFFKALDEINVDYPEFKFEYIFRDTNGLPWTALKQMADLSCNKTVSAFIGPDGYCASAALAATSFELPYLTYGCHETIPAYNLAEVYTFVSTQPSPSKIAKFIMPLLKKFQWNSFAIISGEDLTWRGAAKELESQAISSNLKVNNITYDQVMDLFYPGSEQSFVNILKDTMEKTRIYVLLGDYDAMVEFSRVMYAELGEKRGEYILIGVDNRGRVVDHYEYFIHSPIENFDTLKIDHLKAFRNVFILSLSHTDENWPAFVNETYRRNKEHPVYFSTPPTPVPEKIPILPLKVAYLYDAVKIYAKALNETYYTPNESIYNSKHVISKLRDHSYKSIQGFNVYIDKRGDNDGNYTVLSIGPKKGQSINEMESVCEFRRANNSIQVDCVKDIDWLSGKPPLHEPECGFQGEKCNTNWELAIIGSVLAAAVIVLLALGLVVFRVSKYYRYEKKLASLLWKIDREDLRFVDSIRDFYSPNRQRKKVYSPWKFILPGDNESEKRASKKEKQKNTDAGSYRGTIVFIKQVKRRTLTINRDMKKQLQLRKELSHDNINRFIGACIELPDVYIVTAYCARGSLQDILRNEDSQLDDMFVSSLVADLIKGMIFIHDSNIISHGNLKTSNCLVDSRWVLQIADFGLPSVLSTTPPDEKDENYYEKLLWQAPELLRELTYNPHGTPKADVYAFAIILYELHGKKGPWGSTKKTAKDIIERVKDMNDKTCYRPDLKELSCENYILSCIRDCWAEDPDFRPDFKTIRTRLKPMHQGLKANIFDNMLAMMEKYANNLEVLVAERTEQLSVEKKMTENLLLRMLPRPVAEQLKRGDPVIPEQYECVSIYFSDIVGFTALSAVSTPMQVIDMLNDLYSLFDCILEGYDVYKVETIGDAYVVVSGLPIRNHDNHAGEIASMSLHLLSGLSTFRLRHQPDSSVKIRIGIHSGPCCAGVVGNKMPRYCLFGDTVNTASRMESTGEALKIHCSQECKAILDKLGGYKLEERGYVSLKGKGEKLTYFLTGEDKNHRIRRISTDKDNGSERRCVSSGNPDYSPQLNGYDTFVNAQTMPEIPEHLKSPKDKKQISFQTVSPDDVRVHTQRPENGTRNSNAPTDTVLVVHETVSRDPSSSPREGSPQSDSTCSECEQTTFSIEDPNERKCLLKSKNAKQCHKVRKHNSMLKKPVHVCDDFSQTNGSVPESIL